MEQKQVPILNKNDPESLYSWIAYRVSCPQFRNPIKNFIDENCSTFVDIDENSFEQGQLFNEMNLLIENLLKDVLEEGHITQEDFLKAAERGMTDKKYKKYFNQIINFGDYTFFKSVMTKRNYQIIQMAENQMNQEKQNENNEGKNQLNPEIVQQMLENEQTELNEAIKQSLAEEEEKRRIAIIEEEEMKRAIKQSLIQSKKEQAQKKEEQKKDEPKKEEPKKEEPKKEEPKKEEPKKEEPKKEEPKKEEPKKFAPTISSIANFQYSGEEKPKESEKPTIVSSNKGYQFQVSSRAEEFGVTDKSKNENKNESKNSINDSTNPAPIAQKESKKPINDEKIFTNEGNEINLPKKDERITRDFVNIFEEKKLTLAPLVNKAKLQNPFKSSLKDDLEKNKKANVQKEIERMKIKTEKNESAKEIIQNSLKQSTMNKSDINYMEDDGGLLIDDDEEDNLQNEKRDNTKNKNIHFGRIAIPKDFNDKIPEYNKEKQEQLKEYREKVLKMKKEEREQNINNQ